MNLCSALNSDTISNPLAYNDAFDYPSKFSWLSTHSKYFMKHSISLLDISIEIKEIEIGFLGISMNVLSE